MGLFSSRSSSKSSTSTIASDTSGAFTDLRDDAAFHNLSGLEIRGAKHGDASLDLSSTRTGIQDETLLQLFGQQTDAVTGLTSQFLGTVNNQQTSQAELAGSSSAGVRGVVASFTPIAVVATIAVVAWGVLSRGR